MRLVLTGAAQGAPALDDDLDLDLDDDLDDYHDDDRDDDLDDTQAHPDANAAAGVSQSGASGSVFAGIPATAWSRLDAVDLAAEFGTSTGPAKRAGVLAPWRATSVRPCTSGSARGLCLRHSLAAASGLEIFPAHTAPAAPRRAQARHGPT